ncbi:hypothetical protein [Actinokineospora sp.]|uniref:hypothetical protein n=1 Tax=Actinokineospora sp. TaxID=1872133 RepID=UPI00403848AC
MTPYRGVLVADLDGTITDPHEPLTAARARLLTALVADGVLIAVVSGSSAADIGARVCARIDRVHRSGFLLYANNGGCCFQVDDDLGQVYAYNHAAEFSRHRAEVHAAVTKCAQDKGLGDVGRVPGKLAPSGRVCVEDRESQTTVTLRGLAHHRPELVGALTRTLGERLLVRAAGRKSIDITLVRSTKAFAAEHLASRGPLPADVVIAGDSFGPGQADLDLLRPALRPATVFCAGDTAPDVPGFTVVRSTSPGRRGDLHVPAITFSTHRGMS